MVICLDLVSRWPSQGVAGFALVRHPGGIYTLMTRGAGQVSCGTQPFAASRAFALSSVSDGIESMLADGDVEAAGSTFVRDSHRDCRPQRR